MDHLHHSRSDAVRHRTGFLMMPTADGGWKERWWSHDRGGRRFRVRYGRVQKPRRKKFVGNMKYICVSILL